ncbi:NAD(P)/FAD-dependent oxidoreductase [Microbacterium sp. 22303]|uniref:NAD(P)/FAD-dependent oxidoreductase n=1 Tax=Microbacterium sp. 22303 TaxID=3453905 RepID=UPI003F83746F
MKLFDVVIVGGGHAAAELAANYRRLGSSASIAIVSEETVLPYERPPLSKAFLGGTVEYDDILLREASYWERSDVTVLTGERVVAVDVRERSVRCESGAEFGYGDLVWAAGGRARPLPVPGADAAGVHYIRTLEGVTRFRDEARRAKNVVVVGAGYIGMETAAVLRSVLEVPHVTVVETFERVLSRVTSEPVSEFLQNAHEVRGVRILRNATVRSIEVESGSVTGVRVDDEVVPADLVVVGIGIIPNIDPLQEAGVACSNGVDTDALGRTDKARVWAVGDCANTVISDGRRQRLESAPGVAARCKIVAASMLGHPLPSLEPAWFWSDQYDIRVKTVGVFTGHDRWEVVGDPNSGKFAVRYFQSDHLIAVDTINDPKEFNSAKKLLKLPLPKRHISQLHDSRIEVVG